MVRVEEELVQGKSQRCEDRIFKGRRFMAVIDGCTSKNNIMYGDLTGGEKAGEVICEVIGRHDMLNEGFDAILSDINASFAEAYKENGVDNNNPENRMGAVFIMYDIHRKKIYKVGDCQAIIIDDCGNEEYIGCDKKVDEVTSEARAFYNQSLLESGEETVETLMKNDKGREFILPLLKKQSHFENIEHEYGYAVVNGEEIPPALAVEFSVDDKALGLILASDGYPKLFSKLQESEAYLRELLNSDPLMITEYKSTKGVQKNNNSFDDRAYISMRLLP